MAGLPFIRKFYVDYRPVSGLQDNSPVEFNVPGDSPHLVSWKDTMLCAEWHLEKDNQPAAQSTGKTVVPVNLIHHSMWSHVDVHVQHQTLHSVNDYAYRAYLESLIGLSNTSTLNTEGWYPDEPGEFENYKSSTQKNTEATTWYSGKATYEDFKSAGLYRAPNLNTGFTNRLAMVESGKKKLTVGPLHIDLCQQDQPLLPGVDVSLTLWPSPPSFYLLSDLAHTETAKWRLKIDRVWLRVCYMQLTEKDAHRVEQQLTKKVSYPLQSVVMKSYTIPAQNKTFEIDGVFQGKLPSVVLAVILPNTAYRGDTLRNPFYFGDNNLTQATVYVDGVATPHAPLSLEENNLNDAYFDLLKFSGGRGPSLKGYEEGSMVLCFDLAGHQESSPRPGHTRMVLDFKTPDDAPRTLLLYAIVPQTLHFDRHRQLTVTE